LQFSNHGLGFLQVVDMFFYTKFYAHTAKKILNQECGSRVMWGYFWKSLGGSIETKLENAVSCDPLMVER